MFWTQKSRLDIFVKASRVNFTKNNSATKPKSSFVKIFYISFLTVMNPLYIQQLQYCIPFGNFDPGSKRRRRLEVRVQRPVWEPHTTYHMTRGEEQVGHRQIHWELHIFNQGELIKFGPSGGGWLVPLSGGRQLPPTLRLTSVSHLQHSHTFFFFIFPELITGNHLYCLILNRN